MCIYIYIYITRLASNEIFSPSNKIHREVGRAKNLLAPRYTDTSKKAYVNLRYLAEKSKHTVHIDTYRLRGSSKRSGSASHVTGDLHNMAQNMGFVCRVIRTKYKHTVIIFDTYKYD
jgi:hypothetical protein